jgi:hypothetical protein
MCNVKERNFYAMSAWNRKGAGKHKNKKWLNKNKRRKIKAEDHD